MMPRVVDSRTEEVNNVKNGLTRFCSSEARSISCNSIDFDRGSSLSRRWCWRRCCRSKGNWRGVILIPSRFGGIVSIRNRFGVLGSRSSSGFTGGFIIFGLLVAIEKLSIGCNLNRILWFRVSYCVTVAFTKTILQY